MSNNQDMNNSQNSEKCISKIKLSDGEICNIKDELLRHQINVLLGIEQPDERDNKSNK